MVPKQCRHCLVELGSSNRISRGLCVHCCRVKGVASCTVALLRG